MTCVPPVATPVDARVRDGAHVCARCARLLIRLPSHWVHAHTGKAPCDPDPSARH